jgi:hypothetical protein
MRRVEPERVNRKAQHRQPTSSSRAVQHVGAITGAPLSRRWPRSPVLHRVHQQRLSLALCRRWKATMCTEELDEEEKVPRWLHGRGECMGDRTAMTARAESTRPSQKRGVLAGAGLCSLSSVITHGPPSTSSVFLSRRRALHQEANQKGRSCMDHHQTTKPNQEKLWKGATQLRREVERARRRPWPIGAFPPPHALATRSLQGRKRDQPRSEARPSVLTRVRPETRRGTWPCRRTGAVAKSGSAMRTCSCAR